MEVYVRGFKPSHTEKELDVFLKPHLQRCSINVYHFQKIKNKGFGTITVTDRIKAETFLSLHGFLQDPTPGEKPRAKHPIFYERAFLVFSPGRNAPKEMELRVLELEEKANLQKRQLPAAAPIRRGHPRTFAVAFTYCGNWAYQGSHLGFTPQYYDDREGTVLFGKSSVALILVPSAILSNDCRVDIPYYTIESIVLDTYSSPTISFTLNCPPKFYQTHVITPEDIMASLSLNEGVRPRRQQEKDRISCMASSHSQVAGSCYVYQMTLQNYNEISYVYQLLDKIPGMPPKISMQIRSIVPFKPFREELARLQKALQKPQEYGFLPFSIKFQLQRLATNGFLPPQTVYSLLSHVSSLVSRHTPPVVAESVRRLSSQLEFAGPGVDGGQFELLEIRKHLQEIIEDFRLEGSVYDVQGKHEHLALVHRVLVTPAATYLEGPELEVSNRVLRYYKQHADCFLRVNFADEDGERLSHDPKASNEQIYHQRFRTILRRSIDIAGQSFNFLGFSHSSLRSQTCWFSSPFMHDGELILAHKIIERLGDFKTIRSPAKCAARIGQAFSDTSGFICITKENLDVMPDVERNGRVFSDGCGTISPGLLHRVWDEWTVSNKMKPTLIQIRFQGIKGMLSMDNRLKGEKLYFRESMRKFIGSPSWEVEMCSGNFNALPMYLNRQFIKILEDLRVPADVFLRLQRKRVEELRMMTTSTINASHFLEIHRIGTAANLPTLIKFIGYLGVSLEDDDFLRSVVEIAALAQLRELKYRARIKLDKGITLLGIMDETGFLKEGEIYCTFEDFEGGKKVLVGDRVLITRSPALFPGDIQVVKAVDATKNSLLSALTNCIVFSQHGARDLPSQLSGGDLDGDLYNVIWDPELLPQYTYPAADFPRVPPVDIGREVTRNDMSDFFITFMETDQLGRISTLHLQLADRYSDGVFNSTCINLATLASTAVDFSKTGIPVDLKRIPRNDLIKPDFMAPGPHVFIEDKGLVFEEEYDNYDDGEDVVAALNPDFKKVQYYESKKALGQLFRDIDERKFLQEIQSQARQRVSRTAGDKIMSKVLEYVKREAILVQWEQYRPFAQKWRDTYEHNMAHSIHNASANPSQPVSEVEVISGSLLGKSTGSQSKRVREYAAAMREDFNRHVTHAIEAITIDDSGNRQEALARSIACLAIGVEEEGLHIRRVGSLKSWKYIAAAICLRELELFSGRPLRRMMPSSKAMRPMGMAHG